METGKASYSAIVVASMRALEALRPPEERVCYDPFARSFLGDGTRTLGRNGIINRLIHWYLEYRAPGMQAGIAARTRYIDDIVAHEAAKGIAQLVILGAGYDSRAWRIPQLKDVHVFEIDFPYTQKEKLAKIANLSEVPIARVSYVPIDFNTQSLSDVLREAGYSREQKTLFLMEGLTMYLSADAVDENLAFIATNNALGSSVYFDYFMKSVMDGSCKLRESVALRKMKSFNEDGVEQFTYTIDEKAVPQFLAQRGFRLVEEMRGETLHQRYFLGKNAKRYVHRVCGYVHAAISH